MRLDDWATILIGHFCDEDGERAIDVMDDPKSLDFRSVPQNAAGLQSKLQDLLKKSGYLASNDHIKVWASFFNKLVLHLTVPSQDAMESFIRFNEAFGIMINIAKDQFDGAWCLEIFDYFGKKLTVLGEQADDDLFAKGSIEKTTDRVVATFQTLFSMCQKDNSPPPNSKLMGVMFCINSLFRIYFKQRKYRSCTPLINWVCNSNACPPLAQFSKADQVTYNYYFGRLELLNQSLLSAEEALMSSFRLCDPNSSNRILILTYLIPIRICLGIFPEESLLKKFRLSIYSKISRAVRTGNVPLLKAEITRYRKMFIKRGLYLIMEKMKLLAYRNLFKQVYLILRTMEGKDSEKQDLKDFQRALNFRSSEEVDIDEIECILSSLISKGLVKGYISHTQKKIVFSKTKSFPRLPDLIRSKKIHL